MSSPAPKKWYSFVPNLLTLSNLICGVVAIYFAFYDEILMAIVCMIIGGLFDFFDGFVARMLKVSGELGKQLDSLADLITFGLLPGVMIFSVQRQLILEANSGLEQFSVFQWFFLLSPIIIPVLSALRLAKFNIDTRQTNSFIGVPTPANALFMASLAYTILYSNTALSVWLGHALIVATITILFSFLLITEIKLFALKFKHFKWNGNEIRYVFLGLSLAILILFQVSGFMLIILIYILLSLLNTMIEKRRSLY